MRIERATLAAWSCLLIALGLVWWAYHPGLHGEFLFDDFANMPALGASGPVTHWATFFRYITSGTADPTGRPLTLLTFLLDGHDWPTAAYPFKRTNVLLHLINGVLLALLLVQLTQRTLVVDDPRTKIRVVLASVTAATLWLIHPLFVSTVLYVVQREAMLPMTCVLLGLLLWLRGRDALLQGRLISGIALSTLGLAGCTLLGVLSKANGALLPMYAVLIEYLLLRRSQRNANMTADLAGAGATNTSPSRQEPNQRAARRKSEGWARRSERSESSSNLIEHRRQWSSAFAGMTGGHRPERVDHRASRKGQRAYRLIFLLMAWLPAVAVVAYLIYVGIMGALHGISRPWTLGQRLLTEPRVLFDYLDLLWVPRPFTPGLFNDQFTASSSLWSPPSTALALAGLLGLLVLGWVLRRRHPVMSLAILFYFTGQLLESTTIPLELYFEHRNYIPAMLMFWPLSLWLWEVGRDRASAFDRPKIALALVLILGLAAMTHARADLWGNGSQQALLWATLNPASARAQANAADYEMSTGHARAAELRLDGVLREHPDDPQITLNILSAHCQLGGMTPADLHLAETTLAHLQNGESVIFHWLVKAIELSATHGCSGLTSDAVSAMLDAAERNPRLRSVTGRMQDIYHLRGQLALSLHQPAEALMWFEKGLALRPEPQMAFEQAALLGSAGYPAEGLRQLNSFEVSKRINAPASFGMPRIHAWVLRRQHYWDHELIHLRATLQDDLDHASERNANQGA